MTKIDTRQVPAQVVITSFGYLHQDAPQADLTIDARRALRNPHHEPSMRELTGHDAAVARHVLDTPGARGLIARTANLARGLVEDLPPGRQVTVATGCASGRHRAVDRTTTRHAVVKHLLSAT
ncbi:hypothetical protein ACFWY5_12190 [Nonomuraea sp. NPDC059007]|uniref:RapZ C-terminal domain-containing protein n=1 Tax=Nonomuraea sp. NPDC059007 TaxID=3346692 RepID=UPI00367FBD1E